MTYKLYLTPEAQVELDVAVCFYKAQGNLIAKEFFRDFKRTLEFIENTPLSFQVKYKNVRLVHFEDFKYSIHFFVKGNSVHILRILHQSRAY